MFYIYFYIYFIEIREDCIIWLIQDNNNDNSNSSKTNMFREITACFPI